ncbi:hypothetical protein HanPI659440_Chr04g0154191 [Helianthus annuus]|nr:hypothetical protein HanPI659440_Chr04g0154191 [Helianthus annuus]
MEDVKKKFKDDLDKKTDPKVKTNVVGDKNQASKVKSKFEIDLDNFFIPKNKSHVDPKWKTNVVGDENQTSKVKSKFEMDLDNFLIRRINPMLILKENQMFLLLTGVCPPPP